MMSEKKEMKYIVVKIDDANRYLNTAEMDELGRILTIIREGREKEGKSDNLYIICNQDEPYAEAVWQLILMGEDLKAKMGKCRIDRNSGTEELPTTLK